MKIEIRKQVVLAGQVVRVGEVHEASPSDAAILINSNSAVVFTEPEKPVQCGLKPPSKPKRQRKVSNDHQESGDKD